MTFFRIFFIDPLLTSFIYFAGQVCLLHSPNNVHSESLIRTNLEQFRVMVKSHVEIQLSCVNRMM